MTVYIIHEPVATPKRFTPDFSSATPYGELRILVRSDDQASYYPVEVRRKIQTQLAGLDPGNDRFIWIGGDAVALALVVSVLQENGCKRMRWLRWERQREVNGDRIPGKGYYTPIDVPLIGEVP